jgi:hypothetical protein
MKNSVLPDLWEAARERGLALRPLLSRPDEARADCPFCGDKKGHLYLNRAKGAFNCYRCGEHGGVVRFIALLENRAEQEVLEALKGPAKVRKARSRHPALSLTAAQLKLMGFLPRPGRKPIRRELDWVWAEWQAFLEEERIQALKLLYLHLGWGSYARGLEAVAARSREIGHDLVKDCLAAASSPEPPAWVRQARELAAVWAKSFKRQAAQAV